MTKVKYQIKVGNVVVKEMTNQKKAQRVFHQERGRHGGKVKFVEIWGR